MGDRESEYLVDLGGYINHTLSKKRGCQIIDGHFTEIQNLITSHYIERTQKFIQIGSSTEYGSATGPQL